MTFEEKVPLTGQLTCLILSLFDHVGKLVQLLDIFDADFAELSDGLAKESRLAVLVRILQPTESPEFRSHFIRLSRSYLNILEHPLPDLSHFSVLLPSVEASWKQ